MTHMNPSQAVASLRPGGGTALWDGIKLGLDQLAAARDAGLDPGALPARSNPRNPG